MLDGLGEGLAILLTWEGIAILVGATIVGTLIAILPGIGAVNVMALLIPVTFGMDRDHALMMLVVLMGSAGFAGSITAILVNVPGDSTNASTLVDGYPMSRQGRAGEAIGASAAASALGALFGVLVLIVSLPFVRGVILAFGPAEFFALSVAGVALLATVSTRSVRKGLIAGLLGMAFGLIGINYNLGGLRYTFDIPALYDGIPLTAAVIGLFAIPEMVALLSQGESISRGETVMRGGAWRGVMEVLRRPGTLIRSASIGTALGVIPGVGASVASWVSYFTAVRLSRNPETFGTGNIEGVIAPEAAMDAKEGGSMMPLLALGIPSGLSTAILLSAFTLHGVNPGQRLFESEMPLVWVMLLGLVFANVATSFFGVLFANSLVRLTVLPTIILGPIILVLAFIGGYTSLFSFVGIAYVLFFGAIGIAMEAYGYSRPALLLGLVLLPLAEKNFHLALQINRGSFSFLTRPITLAVLAAVVLALLAPVIWRFVRRRWRPGAVRAVSTALAAPPGELPAGRYPIAFAIVATAIGAVMLVETFRYQPQAQVFPILILVPLIVLGTAQLWMEVLALRRHERGPASEWVRPAWWIGAWIAAMPVLMWLIGTIPATFVYVLAFQLLFDRRRPARSEVLRAVVVSGATALLIWATFVEALALQFPPGVLRLP
ncbi:MAG TPA: tripartite tricarboxylate transporter permease [Candidatus Limnocylindria bacterium]|nr:tripartite tricarboxylate transporter permease [Candidatus Limnocylindria bacterium]